MPPSSRKVILVIGACGLDRLIGVNRFPLPDEKVKTTSYNEIGGGNASNTATAIARLSRASVFSKHNSSFVVKLIGCVGDDAIGRQVLGELQQEGVDLSLFRVVPKSTTGLTTIIVSESTRTCLYTAGTCGDLSPNELSESVFDNVVHLHSDGRHPELGLLLAKEARRRGISVSIDAEKDRKSPFIDEFLQHATTVFTNAGQIEAYLSRLSREREKRRLREPLVAAFGQDVSDGDIDLLVQLMRPSACFTRWDRQNGKEVVITRGEEGAVSVQCLHTTSQPRIVQGADEALNKMEIKFNDGLADSVEVKHVFCDGSETCLAEYLVNTVGVLVDAKVVDTTGAGDTFMGAYILARHMQGIEHDILSCLRFGSWASGRKIGGSGARSAIPSGGVVDKELGTDVGKMKQGLSESVSSFRSALKEEGDTMIATTSWEDFNMEACMVEDSNSM